MCEILKTLIIAVTVLFTQNLVGGEVTRAIFTIGIDNHEPVIQVESIHSSSYTEISFFTELTNLKGHIVTYQWTFNDTIVFEKNLKLTATTWEYGPVMNFYPIVLVAGQLTYSILICQSSKASLSSISN